MTIEPPRITVRHGHQVASQQLLGGMIVAMMFLLMAVAGVGDSGKDPMVGQLTSDAKAADQQLWTRVRREDSLAGDKIKERLLPADSLQSRIAEIMARDVRRKSESAVLRIKANELPADVSSDAPVVQILNMAVRNGRHSSRCYCFQTASEASLQAVLPYADFIANQATLTADQLSFRLDARVPANEIWLEIRSSSDPESDDG